MSFQLRRWALGQKIDNYGAEAVIFKAIKPHKELMANSIPSIQSTVHSERKLFSEESSKQNNITEIAIETISDQIVGGPCMLKWDAFLADLEADKWKVNHIDNSILGPHGEWFDLTDMREIVFQPRKEQALKRLLNQACHYNESDGVIYRSLEDKIKLQVKHIFNFESYLEGLEFKGWKIDSLDRQSLEEMNKNFDKKKQIFLQFLNEKKLKYDLATGTLSNEFGILTQEVYLDQLDEFGEWLEAILAVRRKYDLSDGCVSELENEGWKINFEGEYALNVITNGFATLEDLKARFDVESHLPDFEEIKKVFEIMVDYNEFLEALKEVGWKVHWTDCILQSPEGTSYKMIDVAQKWKVASFEWLLPVGGAISKLNQYYDSQKEQILNDLILNASERYGSQYDREKKHFTNGVSTLTVREMVILLTIRQLELV